MTGPDGPAAGEMKGEDGAWLGQRHEGKFLGFEHAAEPHSLGPLFQRGNVPYSLSPTLTPTFSFGAM